MPKVYIIWGEVPEHGAEPTEYEFKTDVEAEAFLYGVDEASGWLDYTQVPNEAYAYDATIGETVPIEDLTR